MSAAVVSSAQAGVEAYPDMRRRMQIEEQYDVRA